MKMAATVPSPECGSDNQYKYCENYHFSSGVERRSRFLAAVIPCITGVGCLYQAIATFRDRRNFPPPGRVVDIDDCRLHAQTAGSGSPSIVLESGLGGMSSGWGWVQAELAGFCRVVSYDRAGLGWSGPDPSPKTAALAARRLRSLLSRCRIQPPFVLVGHSMGGLFARVFASLFPDETAGMVLLDAVHPDQHLRSAAIDTHMRSGFRLLKAVPLLTRLGYVRLTGLFNAWPKGLPERQAKESEAFLSSYRHLKTTRDESLAWETICAEVRAAGGLGDTPLAVVTAGWDVLPGQPELQGELAALSTDSAHFVVREADHVSLITERRHALTVVKAVRHVVERVNKMCQLNTKRRLAGNAGRSISSA
ncbi:MAG TPA: alpha/beta hydrolase [Geobacteraceae bacterium]|nr:alpha/beta hydrolase [Geobacteraceae bacterium]